MSLAPNIRIGVTVEGGRVSGVALEPHGPLSPQALFMGLPARVCPARAAMIFALCPVAQSLAAELAIDAALGRTPIVGRNRLIALTAEHIGENMRSLVLSWPGSPPDSAALAALRLALVALQGLADAPDAEWPARIAAVRASAVALGFGPANEMETNWFGRLLHEVAGDPIFGVHMAPDSCATSPADDEAIFAAMARGSDLPSHEAAPSVACAVHLRARGAAIAATIDRIDSLGAGDADNCLYVSRPLGNRTGASAVASPRGRLFHVVALDGEEHVASYRILSPTDRNFSPGGPFERAALGRELRDGPAALSVARIAALYDPCVAIDVRLRERAHA